MLEIIRKSLNKSIELEFRLEDTITVYDSKIISAGQDILSVIAPKEDGKIAPIDDGTKIKILLSDENVLFVLDTQVMGSTIVSKVPLLALSQPAKLDTMQRRSNFRIPTEQFPVKVKVPSDNTTREADAICMELSGGGMQVALDRPIPMGKNVELIFKLHNIASLFIIVGEVKRLDKVRRKNRFEFRLGVFFSTISNKMRDDIVKYTFAQQRKLIQRGVL